MLKIVIDTNIFVSIALTPDRKLSSILDFIKNGEIVYVYSEPMLTEIKKTLLKLKINSESIKLLLELLEMKGIQAHPQEKLTVIKDDPSDNMFLEAAVAGSARMIVSGDQHLLKLKKYEDIAILSPRDFLEFLLNLNL